MKTKFFLVHVAVLAFATLPSCTSSGGLDPVAIGALETFAGEYNAYERQRAAQEAIEYQRILEQQEAKRQAEAAAAAMLAPMPSVYPVMVY